MTNLDSVLKSRDVTLLTNALVVKAMVFPIVMYRCESWTIKKAEQEEQMLLNCGVGEDSWELLELQGNQTKGNQHWIVIGRTEAEAEAPIVWPPDSKSQLTGKDPDAGKDRRREEKRASEDKIVC